MNLLELMMAARAKVIGGSDYLWNSFGEKSRYIDFGLLDEQPIVSAVFDAETQEVYCVEIFDYESNRSWRYLDTRYKAIFLNECKERGVNPDICWDDIKYINVDNIQALTLINQFFKGEEQ